MGEFTVYLIAGKRRLYLCDTHLGPESMDSIKDYMQSQGLNKPLVVFFTHADWDHVWGTCAFESPLVVSHELCAQGIYQRGPLDLLRHADYQRGEVHLVMPNLTFDSRLLFADDEVEFLHAPGHTADSAICWDQQDSIIYAGDLIEVPQPSIGWHDLETYVDTLERLKEHSAQKIITSHSGIVTQDGIEGNLNYIRRCQQSAQREFQGEADSSLPKLYTLLLYEDAIAQTAGDSFDYSAFQKTLWQSLGLEHTKPISYLLSKVDRDELKLALEGYMAGL